MPEQDSPLDDLSAFELALAAVLFGQFTGGIFGAVRQPPTSPEFGRMITQGNWAGILGGAMPEGSATWTLADISAWEASNPAGHWWRSIWLRGRIRLDRALVRISREAGSAALRQISAAIAEPRARRLAVALARRRAAQLAVQVQRSTAGGLRLVVSDLLRNLAQTRGVPIQVAQRIAVRELAAELGARLGPAPAQLKTIRRWEAAQRRAGASQRSIRMGVTSRARIAVRARVDPMAGDAFAAQANAARIAVFKDAGLRVHSEDVGDDRVRQLHLEQTAATRRDPPDAGDPWPASAPFRGNPPYEIHCRCYVVPA